MEDSMPDGGVFLKKESSSTLLDLTRSLSEGYNTRYQKLSKIVQLAHEINSLREDRKLKALSIQSTVKAMMECDVSYLSRLVAEFIMKPGAD